MSSEPHITLYDLASCLTPGPKAWNPNTWKARIVLNYKGIAYKTEWISYPDIAATAKRLGCPHGTMIRGDKVYTVPFIVDNSGETPVAISDSLKIAKYLESKFPDKPVFPKNGVALEHAFELCVEELIMQHLKMLILLPTWNILDDRSKVYFRDTREQWLGKTIEDACTGTDRVKGWEVLMEGFDKLADLLDQNGPGVDFAAGGHEPTRADFIIISILAYIKAIAPEEGWNERLRNRNGGRWQRLWDKSEKWRAVH